jgi:hypothetical protein
MFFQQKRGELPADQHRHILSLCERHQFLLALPLEHPPIRRFRPLHPPVMKRSRFAIHGNPPSCASFHVSRNPPHFT